MGPVGDPLRTQPALGPGQQSWYRLEPGTSALAAFASSGLRARWAVRGGPATLATRRVPVERGLIAEDPRQSSVTSSGSSLASAAPPPRGKCVASASPGAGHALHDAVREASGAEVRLHGRGHVLPEVRSAALVDACVADDREGLARAGRRRGARRCARPSASCRASRTGARGAPPARRRLRILAACETWTRTSPRERASASWMASTMRSWSSGPGKLFVCIRTSPAPGGAAAPERAAAAREPTASAEAAAPAESAAPAPEAAAAPPPRTAAVVAAPAVGRVPGVRGGSWR